MTPALTALLAVPEVQPLYERVFNSMPGSCIPDNAVWRQNKADLDALLTAIVAARDAMLLEGTVEGKWRVTDFSGLWASDRPMVFLSRATEPPGHPKNTAWKCPDEETAYAYAAALNRADHLLDQRRTP